MPRTAKPKPLEKGEDASGKLFDTLCSQLGFTRDIQLAHWLGVDRAAISRVRNGAQEVTDTMKLHIVENAHMTPQEIRKLIAKPRFNIKLPVEVQK